MAIDKDSNVSFCNFPSPTTHIGFPCQLSFLTSQLPKPILNCMHRINALSEEARLYLEWACLCVWPLLHVLGKLEGAEEDKRTIVWLEKLSAILEI